MKCKFYFFEIIFIIYLLFYRKYIFLKTQRVIWSESVCFLLNNLICIIRCFSGRCLVNAHVIFCWNQTLERLLMFREKRKPTLPIVKASSFIATLYKALLIFDDLYWSTFFRIFELILVTSTALAYLVEAFCLY